MVSKRFNLSFYAISAYVMLRSLINTPTVLCGATDLEWKVVYVSSAEDAEQDQVLEEVMVGPVPVGINKFVLQVRVFVLVRMQ